MNNQLLSRACAWALGMPLRDLVRPTTSAAVATVLAGCAGFSPDGGFDKVAAMTNERVGQAPSLQRTAGATETARDRVAGLLAQPLDADAAVEVAFLNNRGLQASFEELGIAEADRVRAGRLRNPSFRFGRLHGGGGVEIDRAVGFDVMGLLTMPLTLPLEKRRFEQAQLQAAYSAVGLAFDVRRAYFSAVAAEQLVTYHSQVQDAAGAAAELARRMVQAGNYNRLSQLREQSFHADATAQLARARHQAVAERERLVRLLGLGSDPPAFTLPERLPDLPAQAAEPKDAEQAAMDKRLDVLMARQATESAARSLGLTRATRFVNVLELGYQNESSSGAPRADGYEISLELPLFDFGSSRDARAEAVYRQALHRAAGIAVDARSQVRESYAAYRTAYELARHYRDEVVPLKQRIAEQNLLRYNGMLISVFELLADSREQVAGVTGYVEALRDFWIAETGLQSALTGGSPGTGTSSAPTAWSAGPQRGGAAH